MTRWFGFRLVPAFALILAAALPGQSEPGDPAAAPAAGSAAFETMPLTDAQMKGFLDAMDELESLGAIETGKAQPSEPKEFARALQVSGEAMAVLRKNGFDDAAQFQRVAYNTAWAYSVFEQGGKQAVDAKIAKAKAQQAQALEQLRKHMSPEQVQALTGQMQQGMAMVETMQDVPPENVVLAEKYAGRIGALGKR